MKLRFAGFRCILFYIGWTSRFQMDENLFEVLTPLGFRVHTTRSYWDLVSTIKHPVMSGHVPEAKECLAEPDYVRQSRTDPDVYLFYRRSHDRWFCAVVKRLDGGGFLITAYPTDTVKEGVQIWPK